MESCFNNIQQEQMLRDEHSAYGENIAHRVRKIKNLMKLCKLKNKIDSITFEA